ncbi:alkaline-phosphatase-like protein [Mycena galopus ATCC 62051]|nr:alkaline-phosphatase-like protein [Mycena galopus ATCC 62051]
MARDSKHPAASIVKYLRLTEPPSTPRKAWSRGARRLRFHDRRKLLRGIALGTFIDVAIIAPDLSLPGGRSKLRTTHHTKYLHSWTAWRTPHPHPIRDKRWQRVKLAMDALIGGEGAHVEEGKTVVDEIKANYEQDLTDEFLKPIIVNGEEARIKDGDTLFFFNYRSDRMRELVTVLGLPDKPMEVTIPKDLASSVPFPSSFTSPPSPATTPTFPSPSPFPPGHDECPGGVAGEAGRKAGMSRKYAHATFFFNGDIKKQFDADERFMVDSPKVATYDLQPEMSVQGVADKVAESATDSFDAAVKAISATDQAVGTVAAACYDAGHILVITADHGNAERMRNPEPGERHTAHVRGGTRDGKEKTAGSEKKEDEEEEEEGALCDVAPTVLELMGLPKPEEMTGRSLLAKE